MANTPHSQESGVIGVKKKRWVVCFENTILDLDLPIYEKMVYIVLCSHARKDGPCFPSVKRIAEEASCSRAKVFEALKSLEELGIIARRSQVFEGRGQTSNLYEIIDIAPRPQNGQGGGGESLPPSTGQTGESTGQTPASTAETGASAGRTGRVQSVDGPYKVFEQDHINKTKEKESPLYPPGGGGYGETAKTPERETNGTGEGAKPSTEAEACEAIRNAYNAILPELPQAGKITASRAKALRERIRDDPARRKLAWWKAFFASVREFPWPMGANASNWRADFDWLTSEKGMQKILEGSFNRASGSGERSPAGLELQNRHTDREGLVNAKAILREYEASAYR